MKFGKRILKEVHPEWAEHYLPYNSLKQTLKVTRKQPQLESAALFIVNTAPQWTIDAVSAAAVASAGGR